MDVFEEFIKNPWGSCIRLKSIYCFLTLSQCSRCCCWHPCGYSKFWWAWETAEPHHVTNWSGGQGERVGCQPACPHELQPYMPARHPHRSSQTQNLLWVNGLKLCLGVCELLHVCSHRPSASSGRHLSGSTNCGGWWYGGLTNRVAHGK